MAAGRLLQALVAAGRARSAAAAMGIRRCPLPRQPLGALLSLGAPRTVSTNAVDGDGAGATITRFKIADARKQKGMAYRITTGNTGQEVEDADELSMGGEIAGTENTVKLEPFGVGAGNPADDAEEGPGDIKESDDAEEEGPGDIKESGDGVDNGTARASDFCSYNDARLRAVLEKLFAGKEVVDISLFTLMMQLERVKHRQESLYSEWRHLVLILIAFILKFMVEALFKLYTVKDKKAEKNVDKEVVVMVENKEAGVVHRKIEEEAVNEEEEEEEENKEEEEGIGGGSLLLLVVLLFMF